MSWFALEKWPIFVNKKKILKDKYLSVNPATIYRKASVKTPNLFNWKFSSYLNSNIVYLDLKQKFKTFKVEKLSLIMKMMIKLLSERRTHLTLDWYQLDKTLTSNKYIYFLGWLNWNNLRNMIKIFTWKIWENQIKLKFFKTNKKNE